MYLALSWEPDRAQPTRKPNMGLTYSHAVAYTHHFHPILLLFLLLPYSASAPGHSSNRYELMSTMCRLVDTHGEPDREGPALGGLQPGEESRNR